MRRGKKKRQCLAEQCMGHRHDHPDMGISIGEDQDLSPHVGKSREQPLIQHDTTLLSEQGAQWVIGVDEAGRGPLAGPVYAGAVAIHRSWLQGAIGKGWFQAVHDSKKLKPEIRELIYRSLRTEQSSGSSNESLLWCSGSASVQEIDCFNILEASKRAMYRALTGLSAHRPEWRSNLPRWDEHEAWALHPEHPPDSSELLILVDGLPLSRFPWKHRAIVQGDGKSFAIALASIVAKVERDAMMACLDKDYPSYGWKKNQGYGTPFHLEAIQNEGITPWHRRSFLTKHFDSGKLGEFN